MYLFTEFHSKKIGKELMQLCLNKAGESGNDSVWLCVSTLNHKAIEFYKRWGFEVFGSRILW